MTIPQKVDRRPKPKPIKKDRLSKREKKLIIMDILADNMAQSVRRGFQKKVVDYFKDVIMVKISQPYASDLLKECREDMERADRTVFSKTQVILKHSRLLAKAEENQDIGQARLINRDIAMMEGHMKEGQGESADPILGKQLMDYFKEKTEKKEGESEV